MEVLDQSRTPGKRPRAEVIEVIEIVELEEHAERQGLTETVFPRVHRKLRRASPKLNSSAKADWRWNCVSARGAPTPRDFDPRWRATGRIAYEGWGVLLEFDVFTFRLKPETHKIELSDTVRLQVAAHLRL